MRASASASTISAAKTGAGGSAPPASGLGAWLMGRFGTREDGAPRLRKIESIRITPRQSVALIEVDGERFLLATSETGGPVFQSLPRPARIPKAARAVSSMGET